MMPFRHNSIADNENRSNGGIRTGLAERLFCLLERCPHELFVSSSVHRFDSSIVVLFGQGNAVPRAMLTLGSLPEY
jgi:hypothetical protein